MRNRFPGLCYRCGKSVAAGAGHFERFRNGWRVQHATCAIKFRGTPDAERQKDATCRDEQLALGTGRIAQRARKRLRDAALSEGQKP